MIRYKEKNERNKSLEKGITLITLVVAVSIMIIISGMLIYNAKNGIRMRNLKMMQNDIELLDDKVDAYYVKYGALPAEIEYNVTPLSFEQEISPNDNDKYYLLDLKAFEGLTLNYGADFNNPDLTTNLVNYTDLYVINEQSHHIYYVRGIEMDGVMYYTNDKDEEIAIKEIPRVDITVENLTYEKIDTGYQVTLKNINYNKSYNIKYKEANDSSYTQLGTDITDSNYTFNVNKYGLYYIDIEDKVGKTKQLITSIYAGVTINQDETVKMVKSISDSNVEIADVYLPKGFTVSGVESECAKTVLGVATENEKRGTIDDGVVIYLINDSSTVNWNNATAVETAQTTYDQFVWVPVPNAVLDLSNNSEALSSEANIKAAVQGEIDEGKYPMAIKKDATNYFGVLYQFSLDSTNNTVKVAPLINDINAYTWTPLTTSGIREPSAVTSFDTSSYLQQVNGILNTSYSDSTSFGNALQAEFNAMVNRVSSNKGFWVGRYETSGMNNSTTTTYASSNEIKVNVVKGTTTGIGSVTWYRMYAQQKLYSSKANITLTSSMIWGSQWDQIMIWMRTVSNETTYAGTRPFYVINSQGMGNFGTSAGGTGSIANTGYYAVKNIYDLAGNVYDWTLEAYNANIRIPRGGVYGNTNSSYTRAAYRFNNDPCSPITYFGSRSTLY